MGRNRGRRRARRPRAIRTLARVAGILFAAGVIVLFAFGEPSRDGRDAPEPPTVDAAPTAVVPRTTAIVATDALNVRGGASLEAPVIDTLPLGEEVVVTGAAENGFTPVRYGAGQAWMASEFLAAEGEEVAWPARAEREKTKAENVEVSGRAASAPDPPVADATAPAERWIDVDRATGTVTLYAGDEVVATYIGRVGRDPSADGFYATAVGTYHVFSMQKDLAPTPFAEGAYLSDWVGFDPVRSNGFHSPVRDEDGDEWPHQNATTLGCVRLDSGAAVAVFDFAHIGMRVEIHD